MTVGNLQQRIQDYFEDPYHRGRCERATHYAEARNNDCGDLVAVELRVQNDQIEEAWFDGEGCGLSLAIASMLVEKIEGRPADDVLAMSAESMLQLIDITIEPTKQDCCLVSVTAVRNALNSPMDEDLQGPTFAGPDLGDEC